jgi:hypothetical protein
VREYGFELALCAHVERGMGGIVARQLGTAVHGRRVMDVVRVEPGPDFAERAAITADTIPPLAVESDLGPGQARDPADAFDCHPEAAAEAVEAGLDCGFLERERRGGRTYLRQTVRYPEEWYGDLLGIENKPDLDRPGALETQLLTDVHLALLDRVVLATASHVTGAHLNRIPEAVGVWEFDPATGERTVVRDPEPLPTGEPGVEIVDRSPARTDVRIATADAKALARRRIAERAYGKGWRPAMPACGRVDPDADGLPFCPWHGRVVDPARECGPDCEGHDPADPPAVDREALRAERTPWEPDPAGRKRRQSRLDRYAE